MTTNRSPDSATRFFKLFPFYQNGQRSAHVKGKGVGLGAEEHDFFGQRRPPADLGGELR